MQQVRLSGAWRDVPSRTYVAATSWSGGLAASPFAATAARVAAEPGWTYLEEPVRHDVLADGPGRVLALLEGL